MNFDPFPAVWVGHQGGDGEVNFTWDNYDSKD